jgi:hypothetical protein
MIGFSNNLSNANTLMANKLTLVQQTEKLFREDKSRLFIDGTETQADIQQRIRLFDDMLSQFIAK